MPSCGERCFPQLGPDHSVFSLCFARPTAPLQVGVQRDPGLEGVPEQKQWVSFLAVEALLLTSLLGLHPVLSYSVLICAGPF